MSKLIVEIEMPETAEELRKLVTDPEWQAECRPGFIAIDEAYMVHDHKDDSFLVFKVVRVE